MDEKKKFQLACESVKAVLGKDAPPILSVFCDAFAQGTLTDGERMDANQAIEAWRRQSGANPGYVGREDVFAAYLLFGNSGLPLDFTLNACAKAGAVMENPPDFAEIEKGLT